MSLAAISGVLAGQALRRRIGVASKVIALEMNASPVVVADKAWGGVVGTAGTAAGTVVAASHFGGVDNILDLDMA